MAQKNIIATSQPQNSTTFAGQSRKKMREFYFQTPEMRVVYAEDHNQALMLYRRQHPEDHHEYYYCGDATRRFVLNERDWSSAKETVNAEERQRIGSLIADIRFSRGMTRLDLAQATNIRENTIQRIEGGRFAVTIDILSRIADALGVQITFTKKY